MICKYSSICDMMHNNGGANEDYNAVNHGVG